MKKPAGEKEALESKLEEVTTSEFGSKKEFITAALSLLVVIFVGCGFCLASYFMADDTWQVQFAYRVLNGEWHLALDNFTSSYLGVPALDFYRPLLGFTYILDYALWGMNATGWYVTSLLYGYVSALLYYLTVRLLVHPFGKERAFFCAISAALVFASYPLHVEDICWISGRADLLASIFYLPALIFSGTAWLRYCRSTPWKKHYAAALAFYAVSLLCKETGVTLPLVVAALPLLWSRGASFPGWRKWFLFLAPYALVLAPYLVVRDLALGSPIGGYSGDMGRALMRFLVWRWCDPATLYHILVPLMSSVFGEGPVLPTILLSFYSAVAGLFWVRIFCQRFERGVFLFSFFFVLQGLIPIAILWCLDDQMHNGRIYYFLSMALLLVMPMLCFVPKTGDRSFALKEKFLLGPGFEYVLNRAFVALFACIAIFFTVVDFAVSSSWVDGSKQVTTMRSKLLALLKESDKKLILLGVPRDLAAAHIVLMGFCFKEYFEPPFVDLPADRSESYSDRLLTFFSPLAGAEEPVDAARMRECVASSDCSGPYVWSTKNMDFSSFKFAPFGNVEGKSLPVKIFPKAEATVLHPVPGQHAVRFVNLGEASNAMGVEGVTEKGGLVIEGLDLNPLDYDYLSFDMALTPREKLYVISVYFDDKNAGEPFDHMGRPAHMQVIPMPKAAKDSPSDFTSDGQRRMKWVRVQMRLSHSWHWFQQPRIKRVRLVFHDTSRFVIDNASFESALSQVPQVKVLNLKSRGLGEYVLNLGGGRDGSASEEVNALEIDSDVSRIAGAVRMKLFSTKVNEFFDTCTPFEDPVDHSVTPPVVEGARGKFILPLSRFPKTGYYELRVKAFDSSDKQVGDCTDGTLIYRPSNKGPAGYCRGN